VEDVLSWTVRAIALATLVIVPLRAGHARGRRYMMFSGILLGLTIPGALVMHARITELLPPGLRLVAELGFVYTLAAMGVHFSSLVQPRLRHWSFRTLISIPGQWCVAAGFFSSVWLLALLAPRGVLVWLGLSDALAWLRWADFVPFGVALASLVTSLRIPTEVVRIALGVDGPESVERVPVERYRRRTPDPLQRRPLRVVQISDPHLGPWQPIKKLSQHLENLVAHDPDLVLLTGDFLTMEGRGSPGALARALEPLRKVQDRAYAIFGNHDHEDSDEVRHALETNGIRLLVDEEVCVDTAVGRVQLVGADYVGRGREEHIRALLAQFPRRDDALRIFLLHDPLGFQHVPKGDVDLTLSGHTHGGQVGLVSFGLDWTVLSRSQWPDHGLFGHGSNRLYVHRGTGFYGFPLRVGVPGESSILELILVD
jgi:predicted MPP superfamily phosphohydrolase